MYVALILGALCCQVFVFAGKIQPLVILGRLVQEGTPRGWRFLAGLSDTVLNVAVSAVGGWYLLNPMANNTQSAFVAGFGGLLALTALHRTFQVVLRVLVELNRTGGRTDD